MASQDEARTAIWKAIEDLAKESDNFGGTTRSQMVRDAASAWRAMVGGPQPGSTTSSS